MTTFKEYATEAARMAVDLCKQDCPPKAKEEIEKAAAHLLAAKSCLFRAHEIRQAAPSLDEVG
jgi:hypothetical protein